MPHYHDETAYSRHAMSGHVLDFSDQPHPVKRYRHREPRALPAPRPPRADFWRLALAWPPPPAERPAEHPAQQQYGPDAADLGAVLLMSAGITAQIAAGGGLMGLRAPASAGALYPAELYALACGLPGLEDGVYHFTPEGPGLHLLWPGALAGAAAKALGGDPAALTFFITHVYWRSLWKYRTRAWRYCLLDAGHMLANLELALAAVGLAPRTGLDFADGAVGLLLGLATDDEGPAAGVAAGPAPKDPGPEAPGLPPLDLQVLPLSAHVGRDPAVLAAAAEGNLAEPLPPRNWLTPKPPEGSLLLPRPQPDPVDLLEVVRSRRSRRNFIPSALDEDQVAALLAAALPAPGPVQAQVLLAPAGEPEGGAYRYVPGPGILVPMAAPGDARRGAARASLGQMWVGQAALLLVLWADLDALADLGGPRAYRHAMLAAGRAGQRLYLAAEALGLGACGVGAFFDAELARAAHLPAGARPLYLLAAGPIKAATR